MGKIWEDLDDPAVASSAVFDSQSNTEFVDASSIWNKDNNIDFDLAQDESHNSVSGMCTMCAAQPMFSLVESQETWTLGSIPQLRNRSMYCCFCEYVTALVERLNVDVEWPESVAEQKAFAQVQDLVVLRPCNAPREDSWMEMAGIEVMEDQVHHINQTENANNCYWLEVRFRAPAKPKTSKILLQHHSPSPKRTVRSSPRLQSQRSSYLDVDKVWRWLQHCDNSHSIHCKQPLSEGRSNLNFKLADLSSRRIVDVEGSILYCALSYVYGDNHDLRLEYPNRRFQKGDDLPAKGRLPQTVEDAIHLAQQLGFDYLWVDTLCIDQGDASDKASQINIMDVIYGNASLTIIATDGVDMDSGLAGVSRPMKLTRLPSYEHDQIRIEATAIHPAWRTWPWNHRAWTFQKGLLSRRCLFLDRYHTTMKCQQGYFHDLVKDPEYVALTTSKKYFWENGLNIDLNCSTFVFETQDALVANFSFRGLTFQEDAFDACRGIWKAISTATGVDFTMGIPHQKIIEALCWRAHPEYSITRREAFPSWTWLGWKGKTGYWHWFVQADEFRELGEEKYSQSGSSRLDPDRLAIGCPEVKLNFSQSRLHVSTTSAVFDLMYLKGAGTSHWREGHRAKTIGDWWTILDHNKEQMTNYAGVDVTVFKATEHFFHVDPSISCLLESRELTDTGAHEFLFMQYWQAIRDHHTSDQWLFDMVVAILIVRNDDGTVTRITPVLLELEDWLNAKPQPVDIVLV